MSESGPENDSQHEAVVWVRKDFCDNVTDKEELVGRFSAVSRLPQYLFQMFSAQYISINSVAVFARLRSRENAGVPT